MKSKRRKKPMKALPRILLGFAAFILGILILIQIILFCATLWLNSSSGQQFVQAQIQKHVSTFQDYRFEFSGLSFSLPNRISLHELKIFENDALLAEIKHPKLIADFLPLSEKLLIIDLSINNLILYPSPPQKAQPQTAGPIKFPTLPDDFALPEMPFNHIVISDIDIKRLVLKGDKDITLSPRITADVIVHENKATANLSYEDDAAPRPQGWPDKAHIKAQFSASEKTLSLSEFSANAALYDMSAQGEINLSEADPAAALSAIITPMTIADLSPLTFNAKTTTQNAFPILISLQGQYQKQPADIKAALDLKSNTITLSNIKASVPGITASGNLAWAKDTEQLTGTLEAQVKSLKPYEAFIGAQHNLQPLSATITLKPQMEIDLIAKGQGYQNPAMNIDINDITLSASIIKDTITLKSLMLHDSKDGTLRASGTLNAQTRSIDISAKIRELEPQIPNAAGQINADLTLSGNPEHYRLQGAINPQRIDIILPERFDKKIAQVNIIEKKSQPAETDITKTLALDLTINAPNQIFVRGLGLDAEFGGKLNVGGFANDPQVEGDLNLMRGRYEEFGKIFKITKAKLSFYGSVPPSPELDISAETKAGEVIAKILITGPALTPKINFSSTPEMPEDQIISQILFGQGTENLTPLQAVKLAQSLARFSGVDTGGAASFDPIGSLRTLTGLDDINVETDEEGNANVGLGKRINDKVYLQLEGGSAENSGAATIEIELTPSITLESEVGQDARAGAGIFWKRDY